MFQLTFSAKVSTICCGDSPAGNPVIWYLSFMMTPLLESVNWALFFWSTFLAEKQGLPLRHELQEKIC
jgi:hypothetical protein